MSKKSANDNVTRIQSEFVAIQEDRKRIARKKRRGIMRRLVVIITIFIVVLVSVLYLKMANDMAYEKKKEESKILEAQLAKLNKEKQQLNQEIINLNDAEYIAKLARKEYYLSRSGEIIFTKPAE